MENAVASAVPGIFMADIANVRRDGVSHSSASLRHGQNEGRGTGQGRSGLRSGKASRIVLGLAGSRLRGATSVPHCM